MRPSSAFYRALHSLAHPVTLVAVVLLLLNDHWLRWNYPSWLTGKLGDFTWLIFAPFIAAMVFSWLVPRRLKHPDRLVGLLSFVFIGIWFALAKTVPFIHDATISLWRVVIGWDGTLLMDNTDLLALPGLLVGWWVWKQAGDKPISLRPVGYVAFGLGILGTLATSPPSTDMGLGCIVEQQGELFVFRMTDYGFFNSFMSMDGGFTWKENNTRAVLDLSDACPASYPLILSDPINPDVQYRFHRAQSIDRSTDAGKTWITEMDLTFLRQDARRAYHNMRGGSIGVPVADPGPFDAVIDQRTGNLVVSMGHDGILLRLLSGKWQWVQVGPYRLADLHQIDVIRTVLNVEIILVGVFVILILASFLLILDHWAKRLLLGFSWFLWTIVVLNPPPKWYESAFPIFSLSGFTFLGAILSAFITLAFLIGILPYVADQKIFWKRLGAISLLALLSGGLFLLPYLLWIQGTISLYSSASTFALLLAACGVIPSGLYLKRYAAPNMEISGVVKEDSENQNPPQE